MVINNNPQPTSDSKSQRISPWLASVLVAFAVGGTAFAGAEMRQNSQKDTEIQNLQAENAKLQGQQEGCSNAEAGASNQNQNQNGTIQNDVEKTSDYIYVGEWGIKIKKPENLYHVTYRYDNHEDQGLCVNGIANGGHYAPEFADIRKNLLGCISARNDGQKRVGDFVDGLGPVIFATENFYFIYQHPQAVFSRDSEEAKWEVESMKLIEEMLTKNITTM